MRLRRSLPVVLLVCAFVGAGCSDDKDGGSDGGSGTTTPQLLVASDAYCERATAFALSVGTVNEANAATVLEGLEKSAVEARGMAKEAPDGQKSSHESLASAAEDVIAAIKAKNPVTLDDFKAAEKEVVPQIREKHPDLDTATNRVRLLAQSACNVTIGA